MRHLVIHTPHNRRGRKDGDEFRRESREFIRVHGTENCDEIVLTEKKPWQNFKAALSWVHSPRAPRYEAVTYFGHGTRTRLPSLGLWQPGGFAAQLTKYCEPDVIVTLYACSAAWGFGFADRLQRILAKRHGMLNARVICHRTAGHTTRNPHAEYCGEGRWWRGAYIVSPDSEAWAEWVRTLRGKGTLRFRYPFMRREDIIEELGFSTRSERTR